MSTGGPDDADKTKGEGQPSPEALADVLASIRALVSAETQARISATPEEGDVLLLTREMKVEPSGPQAGLADDIPSLTPAAPIFDEETLRAAINAIVRDELQGELGDRITRNMRKLIRQEIGSILEEQNRGG